MANKMKKIAKDRIRKVEKVIRNLPALPDAFTLVKLYQCLPELYFQKKYELVIDICDAILESEN